MEYVILIVIFTGLGYFAGSVFERKKWREATGADNSGHAVRLTAEATTRVK